MNESDLVGEISQQVPPKSGDYTFAYQPEIPALSKHQQEMAKMRADLAAGQNPWAPGGSRHPSTKNEKKDINANANTSGPHRYNPRHPFSYMDEMPSGPGFSSWALAPPGTSINHPNADSTTKFRNKINKLQQALG
jgi:hypothetical protein